MKMNKKIMATSKMKMRQKWRQPKNVFEDDTKNEDNLYNENDQKKDYLKNKNYESYYRSARLRVWTILKYF